MFGVLLQYWKDALFQVEMQRRRTEEAYMMADAFRIAFEQQLKRRSDQVLRLAEKDGRLCKDVLGHRGESEVPVKSKTFIFASLVLSCTDRSCTVLWYFIGTV